MPVKWPELPSSIPRRQGRFGPWLGRTLLGLAGWGVKGNLPDHPKMVVTGAPHTSNWDWVVAILTILALDIQVSWLGKHTLFEESLRSPLIVSYPGMEKPGVPSDSIVETLDLFPTLADLAGLPEPGFVQGVSLRPILTNPSAPGHPAISYKGATRTIRTRTHRLIRHNSGHVELYDHRSKAGETENLAAERPELVAVGPILVAPGSVGLARAIPLHVGLAAGGQPIVGTELAYFEWRGLELAAGRSMASLGECVLGAEAAKRLGAGPGDAVVSSPEAPENPVRPW